ncbi:acyltransferase [Pseudidiomarina andamanensis]|uniref:Acyltransferase n=1 Tax=Pseudidiomarina andamanensis TaxID=1940690 RepID=A0AA92IKI8_9GAMM|nr:acyltransferase [Pseudidiomarina andamanensis]
MPRRFFLVFRRVRRCGYFFVISGYLITSIIIKELKQNRFSIASFYERRARRILPALFFVVGCGGLFGWFFLLPDEFRSMSQGIVALTFFASNILYWWTTDYFSPAAEENPLLHTWSLGVEEQFYIFFPLLLMVLWKWGKSKISIIVWSLCIVSFAAAEFASHLWPSANFYLLPFRAWELGAGALCAIYSNKIDVTKTFKLNSKTTSALGVVGLVLIFLSIILLDKSTRFPSVYALPSIIGTVLIIAFARPTNLTGKVLSYKPIVAIGLISFSAYLWHQPIFAFSRMLNLTRLDAYDYVLLSILSLCLAAFSWKYVEAPFRNKNFIKQRSTVALFSVVLSTFFIVFGFIGHTTKGFPFRFDSKVLELTNIASLKSTNFLNCQSSPKHILTINNACRIGEEQQEPSVVFWGDSHATAISNTVDSVLEELELQGILLTYSACMPSVDLVRKDNPNCSPFNARNLQFLLDSNIETVILSARWSLNIEGTRFDNGEGGGEYGEPVRYELQSNINSLKEPSEIVSWGIKTLIYKLIENGKSVIVVMDIPELAWDVPKFLARTYLSENTITLSTASVSYQTYKERTEKAYVLFTEVKQSIDNTDKLKFIYPDLELCNLREAPGRCIANKDGQPLYFDDDHLSIYGSELLRAQLRNSMSKINAVDQITTETPAELSTAR